VNAKIANAINSMEQTKRKMESIDKAQKVSEIKRGDVLDLVKQLKIQLERKYRGQKVSEMRIEEIQNLIYNVRNVAQKYGLDLKGENLGLPKPVLGNDTTEIGKKNYYQRLPYNNLNTYDNSAMYNNLNTYDNSAMYNNL